MESRKKYQRPPGQAQLNKPSLSHLQILNSSLLMKGEGTLRHCINTYLTHCQKKKKKSVLNSASEMCTILFMK